MLTRLIRHFIVPRSGLLEKWIITCGRFFFNLGIVQNFFYWRWRIHNENFDQYEFESIPRIHIIIPANAGHETKAKSTLTSLLDQTYPHWQATVVTTHPIDLPSDRRIQLTDRTPNLTQYTDVDYWAQLPAGDVLPPFSLSEFAHALHTHPETCFAYSDSDSITPRGFRHQPFFRPAYSPVYQAETNYLPRFYLASLKHTSKNVLHIPSILHHQGQTSSNPALFPEIEFPKEIFHTSAKKPKISIIIPSHDQAGVLERCLESIFVSTYENYEILLLENHSSEPQIFKLYEKLRGNEKIRIMVHEVTPFNYAELNNFGASRANGEILLFLNNDIEVITPNWIESMLEHALQPQAGIVGAKLYYTDGTLQHAGAIVNEKYGSLHYYIHSPHKTDGYFHQLNAAREVSAVTGACMMIRKDVFEEIGGFDEQFRIDYNDMDLCLNARAHGYNVIITPHAELFHHASITRGHSDSGAENERLLHEKSLFLKKWKDYIHAGDPYFNPNLLILNSFMPFIPNPKACNKQPRLRRINNEYN